MFGRGIAGISVLLFGVGLSACDDQPNENARVHVVYDQVANFACYKPSPDSSCNSASGTGIFVLYSIKSIANTGSEPTTFTFDRDKVVTVTPDDTSNDGVLPATESQLLVTAPKAHGTVVQANATKTDVGCFIKLAHTDDIPSLTATPIDLLYSGSASQPVSVTRAGSDKSTATAIDPTNVTLSNLCNGIFSP